MFNPVTETIMTKVQLKNLAPAVLRADEAAYYGLKSIADYKSSNPEFSLEAATAALERLDHSETALILAENALAAARTESILARASVHSIASGVKDEVTVIYGSDSEQIAAVGLKKKSDRNRPKRNLPKQGE